MKAPSFWRHSGVMVLNIFENVLPTLPSHDNTAGSLLGITAVTAAKAGALYCSCPFPAKTR